MATTAQRKKHLQWLLEITGIPTATGREDRVEAWIEAWVKTRPNLTLRRDKSGNLIVTKKGPKSKKRPIIITAHTDHPAFIVRKLMADRKVELEFRGGVFDPYFDNAKIDIYDAGDVSHVAKILELKPKAKPFKRAIAKLSRKSDSIAPGDVGRWAFRGRGAKPEVVNGRLYTPCCDDLAALAAGLGALDILRNKRGCENVGMLFTRAEEVGFIGCIAACKHRSVPKSARLICLENSRSFRDSPIGGGPIMHVGDRLSVFDPNLTNQMSRILLEYEKKHPDFTWQRKLMPGGACEATAFSSYGYEATCVCLPLGNYHNMADIDGVQAGKRPAKVKPEEIAVDDFHGMVDLLVLCASKLDDSGIKPLNELMDGLLEKNGHVLT